MPTPGDHFDRFEVELVLGQGGMATVYRVRHGTLGSLHALKVLDLPFPSIRARLVQEGQVQAKLRHPHIVAVTDLIEIEGSPGLIMEFIDGPTLEGWLLTNRADAATATSLFFGILDAVAFAHREGLVHRDLKPGNVLLQTVDGRIIPKVTDFGLAKLLIGTATDHRTRTGFAMGTPGYMAPEQVRNAKDVDARADVFALGCILYDLWCGERAFPGGDVFVALERMEGGIYTDPRDLRPDIPETVLAAIRQALEPDRERRLPSCAAMRVVLERAPVTEATQVLWAGGEGPGSAITPARALPTFPPMRVASAPTMDPELSARGSLRTVVGAAAGVSLLTAAAFVAVCAGVAWWAPWQTTPEVRVPDLIPEVARSEEGLPGEAVGEEFVARPIATPSVVSAPPARVPPRGSGPVASAAPAVPAAGATVAPPSVSSATPAPVVSPAPAPVAAAPLTSTPASGRFVVTGQVDSVWLEDRGRRFGAGSVAPGSYTLHARWGTVEVEQKVEVASGQTVTARCDATFLKCAVK